MTQIMNTFLQLARARGGVACLFGAVLVLAVGLVQAPLLCEAAPADTAVKVVSAPAPGSGSPLYEGNRPPLLPSPFIQLPIGSITPKGWVRHQLELEAEGMTGHLEEISKWCKFDNNAWSNPQGQGASGSVLSVGTPLTAPLLFEPFVTRKVCWCAAGMI
jgi:hypothetical protein